MPKANVKFTVTDYLNLPEQPRFELIEGELLLTPSPAFRHQVISSNIEAALRVWVSGRGLGVVVDAPMDVILADDAVVQPDVIVILNENRAIIHERIMGPPDLVVEILSPATMGRDLTTKRTLYAFHGIREYWVVDPESRRVEVNAWASAGYRVAGDYTETDMLTSPVLPGFSMPVHLAFENA